jgi:hypothetical protein
MASTALMLRDARKMSHNTLMQKYLSAKHSMSRLSEKAEEKIEGVVKTLEIQAMAFVFGAIQGAWYTPKKPDEKPGLHWFGAPVEAIVGFVGLGAGLFGIGGDKWADHLINLSNGALAAFSSNIGRSWGYKFQKERAAKKGTSSSGGLREEIASLLDE